MSRLTALSVLYTMLQAKLGENPAVTNTRTRYFQLISDKQKWLANEYDFPFLEDRFDSPVPKNGRYVTFPTIDNEGVTIAMNLERPYKVEVFWNQIWSELMYGIGSQEFNYLNSDIPGQIQDPIQRWRWSQEGQFEVWPMPSTAQTVRFTGQRALDTLATGADTADLDDEMLVLFVASDLLMRSKQADAQICLSQATERLRAQRGAYPNRPMGCNLAGEGSTQEWRSRTRLTPIAVHGN